ncbi:hypothetical protein WP50_17175, partial [Lactiplantibacillus plantarum]
LGRLVKKGALRAEKNGRAFNYYPMVEEQPSMDEAVDTLRIKLTVVYNRKRKKATITLAWFTI